MALHKVCTPKGFSLVEVAVVLAMFAMVGSLALLMSLQSYGGYSFHGTRQLLVTTLQKARSQSLSNVCQGSICSSGLPHGVHIDQNGLFLFQGAAYNPNDATNVYLLLQNSAIALSGSVDIIFAPLTADVAAPATVTILDTSGRSAVVTVGTEGQISWSN